MQSNYDPEDNANLDTPQHAGNGEPDPVEQDPAQMPLSLSSGGGAEDPMGGMEDASAFGKDRGINGFLLLILLLAIGAGTLWVMRMSGAMESSDPELASAEKRINRALQRFGEDGKAKQPFKKLFADTNEAISVFSNDPVKSQIDLDNVQKNPFELPGRDKEKTEDTGSTGMTNKEKAARARELRLEALRRKAEQLTLQSLLSGKRSMAVIDGKVVGKGDTVSEFEVTAISPYGVRLKAAGETFTLRLNPSKESNAPGRRRRR